MTGASQPPERQPYEVLICSFTVTHGMTCCWCMDSRTPSTCVVTLWDGDSDSPACDHHVCTDHAAAAERGDLPEQHSDQGVWAVVEKRTPDPSANAPSEPA